MIRDGQDTNHHKDTESKSNTTCENITGNKLYSRSVPYK